MSVTQRTNQQLLQVVVGTRITSDHRFTHLLIDIVQQLRYLAEMVPLIHHEGVHLVPQCLELLLGELEVSHSTTDRLKLVIIILCGLPLVGAPQQQNMCQLDTVPLIQ